MKTWLRKVSRLKRKDIAIKDKELLVQELTEARKEIKELKEEIAELEALKKLDVTSDIAYFTEAKVKRKNMLKKVCSNVNKFESGSNHLHNILDMQRTSKETFGLGYEIGESSQMGAQNKTPKFVKFVSSTFRTLEQENHKCNMPNVVNAKNGRAPPPLRYENSYWFGHTAQPFHPQSFYRRQISQRFDQGRFIPICHYCGIKGHIHPHCHKLYEIPMSYTSRRTNDVQMQKENFFNRFQPLAEDVTQDRLPERLPRKLPGAKQPTQASQANKQWVKSSESRCMFVQTALAAFKTNSWYLDSGCSQHMSSNKSFFTSFESFDSGKVTFGDGSQAEIKDRLWHERLGHFNYQDLKKLSNKEVVRGLPRIRSIKGVCGPCQQGKQTKVPHKKVSSVNSSRPFKILHMDLMGLTQVESLGGKKYILVVVDDFSRYSWVRFLRDKTETFEAFYDLYLLLENEKKYDGFNLTKIRTDHGTKFENAKFDAFYRSFGIKHEFSGPKTPQQNGVVERKNRVLQEMERTMMHAKNVAQRFWAEAVNTSCYMSNRVHMRSGTKLTCYELWVGKKPTVKHFKVYGSKCFILRDRESIGKFDIRSDEGIFMGYFLNSRAYRVLNTKTKTMMESTNVIIHDDVFESDATSPQAEPVVTTEVTLEKPTSIQAVKQSTSNVLETSKRVKKNHPQDLILGEITAPMKTRRQLQNEDALNDESWVDAMHEELNQFTRNDVWTLVPKPENSIITGTNGFSRIKLMNMMDVKSAFLNGLLNEEVYVKQPQGFEDPIHPSHVYKLNRALYRLKQVPRAWYERLTNFLLSTGFSRGTADKTLFVKKDHKHILVAQIYVDDIVFGSTSVSLSQEFGELMKSEFEMSMMGELTYFLGFQVKQSQEGIFISQTKYASNLVKKFNVALSKPAQTPTSPSTKLSKDTIGKSVDQTLYRSIIGSLLYLTASRPGIAFSVCVCARYQADPKESHLSTVKGILQYINGTLDFGIFYSKDTNASLAGYSDAD
ncbi:uncharacterized protein LOC120006011 [Tripterygium wilfordii]|uniref:uncharacterized protein LOC120006011 n=1 Tax=Tripterygium wilfordii TaxID=458696 RepID=UPI0018F829B8|nr:uncharacterized protein LOC120006011 [Tripterygium wilfordii]